MKQTAQFKSLDDWLPWLETLSPREIVLGLERVQTILERLELNYPATIITVGGTNGKGSSVAMLEALLLQRNLRIGRYTSPHLRRYNERICIDGTPADDQSILNALRRVEEVRGDVPLTYFEYGTLAALVTFVAENVSAWLLEVGLGGRLDAVNALEPNVSLITNVALDHCAWLGDNTEAIGYEKAGIMRASKPVIFGGTDVPETIRSAASAVGADLRVAGTDFTYTKKPRDARQWNWHGTRIAVSDLQALRLPGDVQLQNAAAVLAVIEALGFDDLLQTSVINAAMSNVDLEGRFQIVNRRRTWILDVAHNPHAARALADRLLEMHLAGEVTAIVGLLQDKDVAGVIEPLRDVVDRWVAVPAENSRAEPVIALAQQIADICTRPCRIAGSIAAGLEFAAAETGETGAVLVAGSFFVVGPALDWLGNL